jgi:hypothetical protein
MSFAGDASFQRRQTVEALAKQGGDALYTETASLPKLRGSPAAVLREAVEDLKSDDWAKQFAALDLLRSVVVYCPDALASNPSLLHSVVTLVMGHVKNLRSSVSRNSMMAFVDMFNNLGRAMDPELDLVTAILIPKIVEGNAFLVRVWSWVSLCVSGRVALCPLRIRSLSGFSACGWSLVAPCTLAFPVCASERRSREGHALHGCQLLGRQGHGGAAAACQSQEREHPRQDSCVGGPLHCPDGAPGMCVRGSLLPCHQGLVGCRHLHAPSDPKPCHLPCPSPQPPLLVGRCCAGRCPRVFLKFWNCAFVRLRVVPGNGLQGGAPPCDARCFFFGGGQGRVPARRQANACAGT